MTKYVSITTFSLATILLLSACSDASFEKTTSLVGHSMNSWCKYQSNCSTQDSADRTAAITR